MLIAYADSTIIRMMMNELNKFFPSYVKENTFQIVSRGNKEIEIRWEGMPTEEAVEKVLDKFLSYRVDVRTGILAYEPVEIDGRQVEGAMAIVYNRKDTGVYDKNSNLTNAQVKEKMKTLTTDSEEFIQFKKELGKALREYNQEQREYTDKFDNVFETNVRGLQTLLGGGISNLITAIFNDIRLRKDKKYLFTVMQEAVTVHNINVFHARSVNSYMKAQGYTAMVKAISEDIKYIMRNIKHDTENIQPHIVNLLVRNATYIERLSRLYNDYGEHTAYETLRVSNEYLDEFVLPVTERMLRTNAVDMSGIRESVTKKYKESLQAFLQSPSKETLDKFHYYNLLNNASHLNYVLKGNENSSQRIINYTIHKERMINSGEHTNLLLGRILSGKLGEGIPNFEQQFKMLTQEEKESILAKLLAHLAFHENTTINKYLSDTGEVPTEEYAKNYFKVISQYYTRVDTVLAKEEIEKIGFPYVENSVELEKYVPTAIVRLAKQECQTVKFFRELTLTYSSKVQEAIKDYSRYNVLMVNELFVMYQEANSKTIVFESYFARILMTPNTQQIIYLYPFNDEVKGVRYALTQKVSDTNFQTSPQKQQALTDLLYMGYAYRQHELMAIKKDKVKTKTRYSNLYHAYESIKHIPYIENMNATPMRNIELYLTIPDNIKNILPPNAKVKLLLTTQEIYFIVARDINGIDFIENIGLVYSKIPKKEQYLRENTQKIMSNGFLKAVSRIGKEHKYYTDLRACK